MSTIVTRKSLALGAIVALATTAFAGAPAFAANEIKLAPAAGTSLSTLSTEAFVLESSFAPGVTNQNSQLWFQVKTSTNVSVDVSTDTVDANNFAAGDRLAASTGDASDASAYVRYIKAAGTGSTDRNFIALALHGATSVDSSDVVVTAFVDSSNDHTLTDGEWSTAKTVSFKKYSAVTATASIETVNEGDTTVVGHLTLAGLNLDQIQSEVVLSFGKNSTDALDGVSGDAAQDPGVTAAATTAGDYKGTTGALDALTSADTVEVQAYVGGEKVGSAAKASVTARTLSNIQATVDTTDNSVYSEDAEEGYARTNSAFTVSALALSSAATPAPVAGAKLTATVYWEATWATTDGEESSITINGVKYASGASLDAAEIAVTTDPKGKAVLNISTANFANNTYFEFNFDAQHLNTATAYVTLQDAVYTVSDDASAPVRKVAKNGSTVLHYSVKDQFGVLSAKTNQRLSVATGAASAVAQQYPTVVGGKAAVTVTASKDTTDAITVTTRLQAKTVNDDESISWETVAGSGARPANITINVSDVADDFDTAPLLASTNGSTDSVDSQDLDHAAYDADHAVSGDLFAEITGSVKVQGSEITVSADSDVAFVVNGKLYTGSVTLPVADANGDFSVLVASHKSGTETVTIKTGAVTKTVDVTFATAGIHFLKNTVVGGVSLAQAGRSVSVTATLTDAYGNAVANKLVKFAVDGVGTLSSSDAVTDANGVATVRLTSSYGEDGEATVTVSHNGSDDATDAASATDKNDFKLLKVVTFGIVDASIENVANRVTAVASFSKGKTVGFYVDGVKKWSKPSTSDANVVVYYNLKKGKHTVTVKISGGLVTSEVIIVK
jgi:hypothetical protein